MDFIAYHWFKLIILVLLTAGIVAGVVFSVHHSRVALKTSQIAEEQLELERRRLDQQLEQTPTQFASEATESTGAAHVMGTQVSSPPTATTTTTPISPVPTPTPISIPTTPQLSQDVGNSSSSFRENGNSELDLQMTEYYERQNREAEEARRAQEQRALLCQQETAKVNQVYDPKIKEIDEQIAVLDKQKQDIADEYCGGNIFASACSMGSIYKQIREISDHRSLLSEQLSQLYNEKRSLSNRILVDFCW